MRASCPAPNANGVWTAQSTWTSQTTEAASGQAIQVQIKRGNNSGQVTIRDLLRNALRMRPDRIVMGEVRGSEALDMLQAMNTGHDGSLSTVTATPRATPSRGMETMVLMAGFDLPVRAIREQVSSALHLIVHTRAAPRRLAQSRAHHRGAADGGRPGNAAGPVHVQRARHHVRTARRRRTGADRPAPDRSATTSAAAESTLSSDLFTLHETRARHHAGAAALGRAPCSRRAGRASGRTTPARGSASRIDQRPRASPSERLLVTLPPGVAAVRRHSCRRTGIPVDPSHARRSDEQQRARSASPSLLDTSDSMRGARSWRLRLDAARTLIAATPAARSEIAV